MFKELKDKIENFSRKQSVCILENYHSNNKRKN